MAWFNNLSLQQFSFDDILYIVGPSVIVIILILNIISLLKDRRISKLQRSLQELQKAYEALDSQAKLIIKTDLELHKTQSELDKKISSLYTLQKISHILSTTLDENEIFQKISEEHITELGFDRALVFMVGPAQSLYSPDTVNIKLRIGYNEKNIDAAFSAESVKDIFEPAIKHAHTVSSIDSKISPKHLGLILKALKIQSFICAPISSKGAIVGALLVTSESSYSPITIGDKEIVSILATQIGQSLENAQLFEETWRSHQELENKVTQRTRELSAALEEIKVVTKRKSDFVSAVSHELRTPLTSIKGYASLLSAGKLGELPQPVKERLEKINKHADSLSQLINNILDISRIES
ncbi:MAG: histidine kinase dimerization/phospho-acceptor domain-containing protein, partial [Candidatus Omnitrophica bacterium]|nr:histidine kinase dimerization/phospho-acceptor domain-containing protein [Candidatus Omnitrophota bacterium]